MEAYREYIAGDRLSQIIDLPEKLKSAMLEIIILPTKLKKAKKSSRHTINWDDLPSHKLGREKMTLDRETIYSNER